MVCLLSSLLSEVGVLASLELASLSLQLKLLHKYFSLRQSYIGIHQKCFKHSSHFSQTNKKTSTS